MQKADSNSSAGYVADSSTKVEDLQSSSHDTKPNVSGLPLSNDENLVKAKHNEVLGVLKGLTVAQARFVLDIVIEDFTANAVVGSDQLTSSF